LKFALFGNVYQHEKSAAIRQVLDSLNQHGAQVAIEEEYYDFLCCSELIAPRGAEPFNGINFQADFAISMGGDGTLLKTLGKPDGMTRGELQRSAGNVLRLILRLKG
jgi:NAD+ kinase